MKHFREYNFYVYILFDERAKTTYIGITNDLEEFCGIIRRIYLKIEKKALKTFTDLEFVSDYKELE
jgi:predicted GIY-YIG superfamily endonuclease